MSFKTGFEIVGSASCRSIARLSAAEGHSDLFSTDARKLQRKVAVFPLSRGFPPAAFVSI
jgi:hypothetical protein